MSAPRWVEVLAEVAAERVRQDAKWGEQNHPDRVARFRPLIASSTDARAVCDGRARIGRIAWPDIAIEELAEAVDAPSEAERRAELVQTAAVLVAWIECIDRRSIRHAQATSPRVVGDGSPEGETRQGVTDDLVSHGPAPFSVFGDGEATSQPARDDDSSGASS